MTFAHTLDDDDQMTLGDYRDLAAALGGEDCRAVQFFDAKIAQQGRDEPVLADESQMLALIGAMLQRENR